MIGTAKTSTDSEQPAPARAPNAQVAVASAIVITLLGTAVAAAFVLVKASGLFLTVFGAIVIAEALRPFVDRLGTRMPRPLAVTIVFAALVAVIGGAWWLTLWQLAPQFVAFGQAFPGYVSAIMHFIAHIRAQAPAHILGGPAQSVNAPIEPIVHALLGGGITVATFIGTLGFALVLAIFWIDAADPLRASLLGIVNPKLRAQTDRLFRDLGHEVGTYASGTMVNGIIVAVTSTLALAALRTPYPIVLGTVQGLLIVLPYVGTFIGVILVGAVVFVAQGWTSAAIAMAVIAIIATIEGTFVAPFVFKRSLNMDPFSTTLAIALGGTLFGAGGIVLAIPAAAVLQTVADRVIAPAIRRLYK